MEVDVQTIDSNDSAKRAPRCAYAGVRIERHVSVIVEKSRKPKPIQQPSNESRQTNYAKNGPACQLPLIAQTPFPAGESSDSHPFVGSFVELTHPDTSLVKNSIYGLSL